MTWLYSTVWAAVALFVAGEAGKAAGGRWTAWAWRAWAAGVVLCAVHMALAMSLRYGWDHQEAVRHTAAQAATVYGVTWRGGLYVNYLFLALWAAETLWWSAFPASYVSRGATVTWGLRAFYLLVLFNAAVVFASPRGRIPGIALMAALVMVWAAGAVIERQPRLRSTGE